MKIFCKLEVDSGGSDEILSTNLDPLDLEGSSQCGDVDDVDDLQNDAQMDVKSDGWFLKSVNDEAKEESDEKLFDSKNDVSADNIGVDISRPEIADTKCE
jgi:hypothetical protein